MATTLRRTLPISLEPITANDRLKESFNSWIGASIAFAAVLHFLVLAYFPQIQAADFSFQSKELQVVEIPPQVEVPPPPQEIPRPQVPVISTRVDISQEITIQEVSFAANPVQSLPPPPTEKVADLSAEPAFTPRTIEPSLKADQRAALQRYLERNYPPTLREAGIGARVLLWVYVDDGGSVRNTRVVESSAYAQFDEVAQEAVRTVRFSPAYNRDTRVPVWVQIPISWRVLGP